MRRKRQVREYRERTLKRRSITVADRRKKAQEKAKESRRPVENSPSASDRRVQQRARIRKRRQRLQQKTTVDYTTLPAYQPIEIPTLKNYFNYSCKLQRTIVVCHLIESLGMGGAQTMMMELFTGLNRYFGEYSKHLFICVARKWNFDKKLYSSYGVAPQVVPSGDLRDFCKKHKVDICVHHRISISACLRKKLPENVKYMMINHTWNRRSSVSEFHNCDLYVSVCDFLRRKTQHASFIHETRKVSVLNGIENDYIAELPNAELEGGFITGRCHRLVPSKFRSDSIHWLARKVTKFIPDISHYLMGNSKEAKTLQKRHPMLHYLGPVTDRQKKMSIIKSLDVYFYETFQDEGASIAILESLASGVPVLTRALGGCHELVINGVNGFIVRDRSEYLLRLNQLYKDKKMMTLIRQQCVADFENRLHVKHTAAKYMQLFEAILK